MHGSSLHCWSASPNQIWEHDVKHQLMPIKESGFGNRQSQIWALQRKGVMSILCLDSSVNAPVKNLLMSGSKPSVMMVAMTSSTSCQRVKWQPMKRLMQCGGMHIKQGTLAGSASAPVGMMFKVTRLGSAAQTAVAWAGELGMLMVVFETGTKNLWEGQGPQWCHCPHHSKRHDNCRCRWQDAPRLKKMPERHE